MGGKSKRSNSSQVAQTNEGTAMKMQGDLQSALLNKMFPAFGAMVRDGMSKMEGNPAMHAFNIATGQPVQMQMPSALQDFISKYGQQQETPDAPVSTQPVRPQFSGYRGPGGMY